MKGIEKTAAVSTRSQPPALQRNVAVAAKGAVIAVGGRLLEIVQRGVLGVLLARFLGAEQYGLYNLALSAATIAGTFALLGLDTALVRYVAAFASRRDSAGISGVLRVGLGIPALISALIGLVVIGFADPIAEQWFHEPRLVPLLRLVGLVVPFVALNSLLASASRGFKNQHYTVIANFACKPLVKISALASLALIGLNAELAVVAFIIAELATFALFVFLLNKQFPLRHFLDSSRVDLRDILVFSGAVYLSQAVNAVTLNIQSIVLATSGTVVAVGIFAVASQASMLSRAVMSAVTTAAMPIVSELHEQRNRRHLKDFYQITTKWTFMANLPLFMIVVMLPEVILSVFGESFMAGAQALTILTWASLVKTGTGTNSVVLDMSGHSQLKFLNSIATAVTTIGLNVLLVPSMGVMGAAWAYLSAAILLEVLRLVEVYLLFGMIPYNRSFLKPITAGFTAAAAALAIGYLLPELTMYFRAMVQGVAILLTYATVMQALGLSPEERVLVGRLRRRIKLP